VHVVIFKIFNYFLILFLLQSCSGERIGNFLELTFNNADQEEDQIYDNNSNTQKVFKNKKYLKDSKKLEISKTNQDFKDSKKLEISKTNKDFPKVTNKTNIPQKQNFKLDDINYKKNKISKKNISKDEIKIIKNNYDPQSYKVIIILKGVDPTAPSETFSNVLKNADINFEIEKIERFEKNDFKNLK
tara:strand:+ start:640 stop:1200 length:561 start_codon:yes stop_codon:yes gene_type:complete